MNNSDHSRKGSPTFILGLPNNSIIRSRIKLSQSSFSFQTYKKTNWTVFYSQREFFHPRLIKQLEELSQPIKKLTETNKTLEDQLKKSNESVEQLTKELEKFKEKEKKQKEARRKGGRIKGLNSQDYADNFILEDDFLKNIKSYEELKPHLSKYNFKRQLITKYSEFRIKCGDNGVCDATAIKHIRRALENKAFKI